MHVSSLVSHTRRREDVTGNCGDREVGDAGYKSLGDILASHRIRKQQRCRQSQESICEV